MNDTEKFLFDLQGFLKVGGTYQTSQPEWVGELTEAQQAVLEPPISTTGRWWKPTARP